MPFVILGLGSNLGDREMFFGTAIRALEQQQVLKNIARSAVYESDALMPEGAPESWNIPFLNMAIGGETSLAPLDLLRAIKAIEAEMGRKPDHAFWGPREIDIDILTYENVTMAEDTLHIPHRFIAERPFALLPLLDIAPNWAFPDGRKGTDVANTFPNPMPCNTHKKISTQCVGILNITPDSFSDGNLYLKPEEAVHHAQQMVNDGARVIDIGAESTRPGATPLRPDEEWRRLKPVLEALQKYGLSAQISVDTRHAGTAAKALELGAAWINDVSGLSTPAMLDAVKHSTCKLVLMHNLGVPASKDFLLPDDVDVIATLIAWFNEKIKYCEDAGIARSRLILDPGIGFGKTAEQSLQLIKRVSELKALGLPLLYGHSRKSFLAMLTQKPASERDAETALITGYLAANKVDYVRVHHVALNREAITNPKKAPAWLK